MRLLILVPALVLSLAASKPAKPAAKADRTVHGMVQSVQGNTLTISILKKKAELKEHKIKVKKGAAVTLNGKPVALSALTAGENVTIHFSHGAVKEVAATAK